MCKFRSALLLLRILSHGGVSQPILGAAKIASTEQAQATGGVAVAIAIVHHTTPLGCTFWHCISPSSIPALDCVSTEHLQGLSQQVLQLVN